MGCLTMPKGVPNKRYTPEFKNEAFAKIPAETSLILHSDRGWQYQHKQHQRMLCEKGIWQSMSRERDCLDNAVIENFFGLLKSEL